jgi:hypothetical protein
MLVSQKVIHINGLKNNFPRSETDLAGISSSLEFPLELSLALGAPLHQVVAKVEAGGARTAQRVRIVVSLINLKMTNLDCN